MRRTFTLLEFAALVADADGSAPSEMVADAARRRSSLGAIDFDVPDPMGRSTADHQQAARLAAGAVESIVSALARTASP
jgi:hypothetical protein